MSNKHTSMSESNRKSIEYKRAKTKTSVQQDSVAIISRPKTILERTRVKLAICRSNFLKDLPNKMIEECIKQKKVITGKAEGCYI